MTTMSTSRCDNLARCIYSAGVVFPRLFNRGCEPRKIVRKIKARTGR